MNIKKQSIWTVILYKWNDISLTVKSMVLLALLIILIDSNLWQAVQVEITLGSHKAIDIGNEKKDNWFRCYSFRLQKSNCGIILKRRITSIDF